MYVWVSFLGLQRTRADTDKIRVPLLDGRRVADVLTYVKKSYPKLPFPDDALLVVVNDRVASLEKMLENKDRVTFLPVLGGG
jgi:molybdopterin converting factor small subunit